MGVVDMELAQSRLARAAAERNESLGRRESVTTEGIERRPVIIKLIGGPADGQHATVIGFGRIAWQRIPGKSQMEPWFAKYVRSAPGEYTWAEADPDALIDVVAMADKIAKQGRGRVMGSYGA